jgi:hypothetical protein
MQKRLIAIVLLTLLVLSINTNAISPDEAVAIVSIQNNYLMNGETTSVAKELIQYKTTKYIVVAAGKNSVINCYIPINESSGEIAKLDLEIREIIRTTIIYSKMNELNQSIAAANWPLSYYTKNTFYDLAKDFATMKNSILTVKTELEKISAPQTTITKTTDIQSKIDELISKSNDLAEQIELGRTYEQNFFNSPDSNETVKYENYYKNYFTAITNYKTSFNELESQLTQLSQAIASLETEELTIDQKRSLQSILVTPTNARKLPSFFGTTDQLRTTIESVFNTSKNSENFATTLASREVRNSAWKEMYGRNEALLKIDKSFETLELAANAILSTENKDQWIEQTAVDGLTANWTSAKSRYNNAEYEKAKDYAIKAQKNIGQVIEGGVKQNTNNTNDYIPIALGILIIALVGLFIYENFYLKKKKKKEDFDEPNY